MENKTFIIIKRLKQIIFLLAIFSFTSAVFLFGLTFGLGAGWEHIYREYRDTATIGTNEFQHMAFSYFIVSVLLLLFILFLKMRDGIFLKFVGFILLIFSVLQYRILIMSKPDNLPNWIINYSGKLEIILYLDFLCLGIALLLLVLQLYLIILVYRSSIIIRDNLVREA